ncbi:MAG: hydratase [Synergistaceae bacterium]|jgi:aconitate hydratase|nr:hydratase [Synergistaceae bacterium]
MTIRLSAGGTYLCRGTILIPDDEDAQAVLKQETGRIISREEGRRGTIAYSILSSHNIGDNKNLRIKFDAMSMHDITSVGVIQTARASGMKNFPVPMIMTNCHNSLCAVGGTINQDDHVFALSAAKKYGGVYVPPHLAVIHSYNREMLAGCGKMILATDSHTRYGALGAMAVGEGGGELVKQLIGKTYDISYPEVIAIYLTGKPQKGVGPHDVALSIIGAVFEKGYVKNKVLEFIGEGITELSVDFRNGIDVMTTETACWSSIWKTDKKIKDFLEIHGRPSEYAELSPAEVAYYDGVVHVNLSAIEPSIAMPFHPSNVFTIREFRKNAVSIMAEVEERGRGLSGSKTVDFKLRKKVKNNEIFVDQAVVCGCAGGTFDNITAVADILAGNTTGNGVFSMSIYPGSQPIYIELVKNGTIESLMKSGVIIRSAFCGPCFGAGDTPANGEFSIRHTTRNFPSREGSKSGEGQSASVALMDARSIAATALNGGILTAADELDADYRTVRFFFDASIYNRRVYDGVGKPVPDTELVLGPNIKSWPEISSLTDDILLKVVSYITDSVTTTDELLPSGETSSFRSNPLKLAEFTLGRKDPGYVSRARSIKKIDDDRRSNINPADNIELAAVYEKIRQIPGNEKKSTMEIGIGSVIYANKPGDGSAREQAASCQKLLGTFANIAREYATKRYRSNLINWGIIPFLTDDGASLCLGNYVYFPSIKQAILEKSETIRGFVIEGENVREIEARLGELTDEERKIIVDGCLINHYRGQMPSL